MVFSVKSIDDLWSVAGWSRRYLRSTFPIWPQAVSERYWKLLQPNLVLDLPERGLLVRTVEDLASLDLDHMQTWSGVEFFLHSISAMQNS